MSTVRDFGQPIKLVKQYMENHLMVILDGTIEIVDKALKTINTMKLDGGQLYVAKYVNQQHLFISVDTTLYRVINNQLE